MKFAVKYFPGRSSVLLLAALFLNAALTASAIKAAAEAASELHRVVVIATGGTIAMQVDPEGRPVPAVSGEDLVAAVPELKELAQIEVVQFSNIPSDYMDPVRWIDLARLISRELAREGVSGVVVTHGTDTLEETAYFLDLTVQSEKPVVCVGALRNASEKDSDGPRNLLNAVRQVLSTESRGKGVTIGMNQYIHAARSATKSHTSNVQSFESGRYGPLGVVDPDRVIFYREPLRRQSFPIPSKPRRVEILSMYAGADGELLRHAVDSGAEGIVVAALGLGNVNPSLFEAIGYAVRKGVPVVISSRVPHGRVLPVYGFRGGGATLQEIGAVFSDDLPPWKARILVMLAMETSKDPQDLQKIFDR